MPELAFAGGFSTEDHLFKALALGSPFAKAVCMGRALMIPGMVGKNFSQWLNKDGSPKTISQFGETPEQTLACRDQLSDIVGKDEMKKIPLGAIGIFSYTQQLSLGLQRLMAGVRCLSLPALSRRELTSRTRQCADVTGIPCALDAYRDEAAAILDS